MTFLAQICFQNYKHHHINNVFSYSGILRQIRIVMFKLLVLEMIKVYTGTGVGNWFLIFLGLLYYTFAKKLISFLQSFSFKNM